MRLLAETTGIFTETAGGVTTATLAKLAERGDIDRDERVVLLITGDGLKTIDTVRGTFDVAEIDPTVDAFDAAFAAVVMSVTVKIPTQLRAVTGGAAEASGEGGTVGEVLDSLYTPHEELRDRIAGDDGELRRFVNVYLAGRGHPLPGRPRHARPRRRRADDPAGGRGRVASRARACSRTRTGFGCHRRPRRWWRGGMAGLPVGRAGGGVGVVGVIIFLAIQLLGGGQAPSTCPPGSTAARAAQGEPIPASQDPDKDLRDFSSYVFTDVQDTWTKTFKAGGRDYRRAKLVLYTGATGTGCGTGSGRPGPVLLPGRPARLPRPVLLPRHGDAAAGRAATSRGPTSSATSSATTCRTCSGSPTRCSSSPARTPTTSNALSVRLELQADCYAGVWARSVFDQLEDGDIEEAMTASQAVGDDRLQKQAGRRVNPDSFTHGSSAQRLKWFKRGQAKGEPARLRHLQWRRLSGRRSRSSARSSGPRPAFDVDAELILEDDNPGRSSYAARDRAARRATGEWLVFVDADCVPEPGWLDAFFDPVPADDVAVLAGGIVDAVVEDTLVARYIRDRAKLAQPATYAQTANCAVRRSAFLAVGGWPEPVVSGGDADLCWRLRPRAGAWSRARMPACVTATARPCGRTCASCTATAGGCAGSRSAGRARSRAPRARELLGRPRMLLRDPTAFGALDVLSLYARDSGRLRGNT